MSEISEQLDAEILACLNGISGLENVGSEEYTAGVKSIKILHDAKIEEEKIAIEKMKLKNEEDRKTKDDKNQKRDKFIGYGLRVLEISSGIAAVIVPVIVYKKAFSEGMQFEKDSNYSSPWLKNAMNSIKPKK